MANLKGVKDQIDVKITAELEVDNGRIVPVPFVGTYRKPPVSEIQKTMEKINTDQGVDDAELMDQYLLGWKGLKGEDGGEIEYSQETLAQLLEVREYRKALSKGLMAVLLGKDALRKN